MTLEVGGTVMVTGAASGIGEAVVRRLAETGTPLLLVDRDAQRLEALRADLTGSGATNVCTAAADVTDGSALRAAVDETADRRSALSGLVTCAGIEVIGQLDELAAADWTRCVEVNLTGTFLTLQVALPELKRAGGSVVMIASDAGIAGAAGYAAYCASKHGVIGLMRSASLELAPRGIRVNAVAPGFVETPMATRIFDGDQAAMDAYARTLPLGRFAQPVEVAKAVQHLLSDDASYTSGSIYMVDGAANTGYFEPEAD